MTTEVQIKHNNQQLSLSSDPQKLGAFINGLLGQPQEIRRAFSGNLDINKSFFLNTIALINHRIESQNSYELTAFRAVISYADKSERVVNSIRAFESFHETRSVRSTGVRIHLTYLVKFQNKENPEKQEIILRTSEGRLLIENNIPFISQNLLGKGFISYQILHTERSWGDDIAHIIDNECSQQIKDDEFFIKNYKITMLLLGVFSLLFFLVYPLYIESNQASANYEKAIELFNSLSDKKINGIELISKKIDWITIFLKEISRPKDYKNIVQTGFMFLGFVSFFIFVKLSSYKPLSFITIGEKSEDYRRENINNKKIRISENIFCLCF